MGAFVRQSRLCLEWCSDDREAGRVTPISYKRHRFPPEVIRYAVWLYFRFALSLRDVEDLLAERGIQVSYETIRCWTRKFGRAFARNLRRSRPKADREVASGRDGRQDWWQTHVPVASRRQ